jgi:hypothetical protein
MLPLRLASSQFRALLHRNLHCVRRQAGDID